MNKYESIYRILISFMLVDNQIDENEKKVIQEFLNTKFWESISPERHNIIIHKDKLNFEHFKKDVDFAYEKFFREELYEILDFISKIIKSDWTVDAKEIKLFEILISEWRIPRDIMELLWIKKSIMSKLF